MRPVGIRSPCLSARLALNGVKVAGAAALGLAPVLLLGTTPAAAATSCAAGINGNDANQFATPQHAYQVQEHTQVAVDGSNPGVPVGQVLHYVIQMQFYAPWGQKLGWTVASGDTTSQSFARIVDVDKYATKAAGLYLVHAATSGPGGSSACHVDAYVDVVTSSPSDVEIAAGAVGVAGLAGVVGAAVLAAREGSALTDADLRAATSETVVG